LSRVKLVSCKPTLKYHYVYKSFEEKGREYIGCRSCDCLPEEDTKYFGSFRDKTFNPTEKTILFVCETREEAAEIEIELHNFFDVAVNPQFANRSKATSTGFSTAGTILGPPSEEWKQAQSERMSGEKNPNYGNRWKRSEEWKKERSQNYMGEKNPNYGNRWSWTEERKKLWEGEKNPCYGKPSRNQGHKWNLTEEQKENRKKAALARPLVECPVCGKLCKGHAALANHLKTHKQ